MVKFVKLPREIHLEIFDYVKMKDLKQIALTCNWLKDIIISMNPKDQAKEEIINEIMDIKDFNIKYSGIKDLNHRNIKEMRKQYLRDKIVGLSEENLQKIEIDSGSKEIDKLVDYMYHIDSCYYIIIGKPHEEWMFKLREESYKLALEEYFKTRKLEELKIDCRKMKKYAETRQKCRNYYAQKN